MTNNLCSPCSYLMRLLAATPAYQYLTTQCDTGYVVGHKQFVQTIVKATNILT